MRKTYNQSQELLARSPKFDPLFWEICVEQDVLNQWSTEEGLYFESSQEVLALDQHLPTSWKYWKKEDRQQLPEAWPPLPPPESGNRLGDGSQLDIGVRIVAFDPLELVETMEMRALLWQEEKLVKKEIHPLKIRIYLKNEILMMLEQAGFRHIKVQGDHTDEEATAEHGVLVFIAQK